MKATFEFDLSDTDEQHAHRRHTASLDMALALFDIQQHLRAEMKHRQLSPERYEELEKITTVFYEILNNHNISIDTLIY